MTTRPTAWKPGQSGNPNGRPPKQRALTEILERAGGRTVEIEGKKVSGRRLVARMAWEGLTTGIVTFPDDKILTLSPTDWKDLLKWIYTHVDGPPKTELDVTSGGERLNMIEVTAVDYRAAITSLAPGPMGDSDAPGESEGTLDGSQVG